MNFEPAVPAPYLHRKKPHPHTSQIIVLSNAEFTQDDILMKTYKDTN